MDFGRIGIWLSARRQGPDAIAEIEALGYGALWVGGSPSVDQVRPFLEATSSIPVASGILNIWQHEPADVARDFHALADDRFVLGVGVGHPEARSDYTRPLTAMRRLFDG